ncbi:hypothetical protein M405DRAFT_313660 [Rhizopogon salebrosus TDB-379]|nr:hypothetical protein M405DRAFT_313660 [Rhizopogon salebrosus TDB-379]
MLPRLPPDIIDVDALTDEENEDVVQCTGLGMNGQQASFTGRFSSLVTRPTRQPTTSSSRLPAPRGPPQPNLQATNNYLFTYARPTPLDMAEQERRKKRTAMDLRGSPSKKPATTSTIAMANVPSRQKEKRKQQCLEEEGVEVIDLCSSDDDTQAKKPKILFEDNNMEVDRKPVIYANGEDPFQMDISDNAHNNNDPNNSFLRTNTPLPQPSSFQEPEYDSEDEYVNYMASLNISDEFNWKPVPANNKAEDLSRNADVEIEPSRPPELRPLRPKYFAVHYPVTPTDPNFKDSDKFIWGQVRCGLLLVCIRE